MTGSGQGEGLNRVGGRLPHPISGTLDEQIPSDPTPPMPPTIIATTTTTVNPRNSASGHDPDGRNLSTSNSLESDEQDPNRRSPVDVNSHSAAYTLQSAKPTAGSKHGSRISHLAINVDTVSERLTAGPCAGSRSPLSPNTRNRGYSLRSNLFRKNLHRQGTAMELSQGPSFARSEKSANLRPMPDKKAAQVSVKPITTSSMSSPSATKKNLKGLGNVSNVLPNYYDTWLENRARPSAMGRYWASCKRVFLKKILRIEDLPRSTDGRHIILDASRKKALVDERSGSQYVENWIRSTRFTAYTFLPRQILAQFSKLANFYFLCIAILQMIPGLSTTGMYTTIIPLLFFVGISISKEGYDDYRRYRLDKEENAKQAIVLHAYMATETCGTFPATSFPAFGPIHWAATQWRKLRVGDIIKLKRDEEVPADIVLLHAQGENHIAYVETMALDGETNLKAKLTSAAVGKMCMTQDGLVACRAEFVVEDPNLNLYNFEGRVTLEGETRPLTNAEIIYRGSTIRNTPEIIGMVIYTGEECKIRMNANKHPRIKAPHLQFVLNRIVPLVVVFVICLALFNTIAYQIWRRSTEKKSWYIDAARVRFHEIMFGFFIMFSSMIPLSLYVSMEIIKLAQMILLNDIDMYDHKSDTPFEARTSAINEELGQVTHIFSDKTGTLTNNEMKFRKLSVAGTVWLHDVDLEVQKQIRFPHKNPSKGKKPRVSCKFNRLKSPVLIVDDDDDEATPEYDDLARVTSPKWTSSARPTKAQPEQSTRQLIGYLQRHPHSAFSNRAKLFLLSIALCQTCLPEQRSDGSFDFQSSSPDELALARAAQELGYLVVDREHGIATLRLQPSLDSDETIEEVYEILDVIEFSSNRKRMSVIVRFPDGQLCIICKGADSVISKRLKLAQLAMQKVAEIQKRAERRKSIEAQFALARQSTQIDFDQSSNIRQSFSLNGPRRSMSGAGAARQTRKEVDHWLRQRERDVEIVGEEEQPAFIATRLSEQLPRLSIATSACCSSVVLEEEDYVVDESMVADEGAVIERCFQHINEFATEGLRTLLYGYRWIDQKEYATWKEQYLAATTSLVEREDKVEKAGELIEYGFDLAGATAIEDKLQAGVPDAIDKLRRANIRIWMLTGDKRETAINIGHSCRMIKDYSVVIILDQEIGEVEQHIAAGLLSLQENYVAHSVVVVDGMTLTMITQTPHIEHLFLDLAILADSVVCCRAQPSQKAQLVKAIRKKIEGSITLAIGDGANDIAMIQEAHVGIGITGKEGLQAARTSDYSIAQFRFLTKLLLVHGRWNYIRTCKYILGTLWKEIVFFLTQALYQRYSGYTGTSLYEPWSLATFNTLFTSLPVLIMGIFEKDLCASTLLAVPELYKKAQRNGAFNYMIYCGWMAIGAAESVTIFFLMVSLFGTSLATQDVTLFAMGDMTFVAVVIIISMKMQLFEQHNKSIIALLSVVLSIGAVFLWNIILALVYPLRGHYHVRGAWFNGFGRNGLWWLTLCIIIAVVAVVEFGVASFRAAWFPTDVDIFQELEQDAEIKKRFEEAATLEL